MSSLGDHMKNVCHHFKDYVCQTSEYFHIWKAIQLGLPEMDGVESEGALPPTAECCNTETLPSLPASKQLCLLALPKRIVGPPEL